jgi:exodeoxyribonuclease VII small subunit
MPKKKTELNFEKALSDLQSIVDALENNQLPLQTALEKFEQGVKLSAECQKALQDAEQKVQILLKENGQGKLENFTEEEDN